MKPIHLNHLCGEGASEHYSLPASRDLFKQRCPTVDGGNAKEKMEEIRQYIHNTTELYEKVFDCLAVEEAFNVQPIHKLRHPMIFYYGHTACFYINKLCVAGLIPRINPAFEEMFAIGVDEMSWDDLNNAHYNWPTVQEVRDYRLRVREVINDLMRSGKYALEMPLTFANSTATDASAFWWIMLMAAEHERIHIETASVHVRELPLKYVNPAMTDFWKPCPNVNARSPVNELVPIAGEKVQVGRLPNSSLYGWDCDYSDGRNLTAVPSFKASRYLVSNAEFFAFMKADGYNKKEYWNSEGWQWVQWRKPEHPWFWVLDKSRPDGYALRLQVSLIDLPWNWPCEMNNLEAHAFCRFKTEQLGRIVRLPTEEEWIVLYDRYVRRDMPEWPNVAPGNFNLERYRSSCPVDENAHGDLFDVVGNVWQHCVTPVYPYQGFQMHPFYDDFSLPTFDGRHTCMKGGAWISTGNEATRDARFAFRRHFFQFIGLRYVEGPPVNMMNYARSGLGVDPDVDAITDANFRETFAGIPNGCAAIAAFSKRVFGVYAKVPAGRVMDVTCGAGRLSFELTPHFPEVIGVDYTARHLMPAFAIRERGECQYSVAPRPGAPREVYSVSSASYTWGPHRERATFFQADPSNLHAHLDNFSMIVCWNCLERSYRPSAIPAHLLSRLQPGGLLIIDGGSHWDNIEKTRTDVSSDNSYTTDPLFAAKGDIQESIFQLLGGEHHVTCVGERFKVPVAFPEDDGKAVVRIVELAVYLKK